MSWEKALGTPLLSEEGANPRPRARSPFGRRGERGRGGAARAVADSDDLMPSSSASSYTADEIAHGSGKGLVLLHAPESDADFDRQLLEVSACVPS